MADLPLTNKDLGIDWSNPQSKTGILQGVLYDPTNSFKFNYAPCEEGSYLEGKDNTFIVLGRDRPGGFESGYGAKGHLRAGAIDIVAGRLSSVDARTVNGPVNSSFGADAARIYISQKTDVDVNFGIPSGSTGKTLAQSAIAIKADAVRVIARESLKLVTHTDSKLSNGEEVFIAEGVQLICKADPNPEEVDLQPIPKGDNLVAAFNELVERVVQLNGIVGNFLKTQQKFNEEISDHTHYSPFFAQQTTIDPFVFVKHQQTLIDQFLNVESALQKNVYNINVVWKNKYIVPMSTPDGKYILSRFHKLN